MSDDFPAHFDLDGKPIVRNAMTTSSTSHDARCHSPEGWPCYDPTCPVEAHRRSGKTEEQHWARGTAEQAVVLVDARGCVTITEAALSQLMLDAGWERSA